VTAYERAFRHVATRLDAERAHHAGFAAIRTAEPAMRRRGARVRRQVAPVTTMGLTFPGRVGLAAGFDKNATAIDALGALGFGHVEVGTVTGEPQSGNERPRLFRLPLDQAVLNRIGFNNDGAEVVARRLAARAQRLGERESPAVLGVNIGKTKVVPDDGAVADYEKSTRLLAPHADYLVVNVSSPNTPGLRDLQAVGQLEPLLRAVRQTADQATEQAGRRVPLLVKIAPDLADADVAAVADLAVAMGLDGIVATNTTISREGLVSDRDEVAALGAGGVSGQPLTGRATEVVRRLRQRVGPAMCLIGVGGVGDPEQAAERLEAGATLLQAYTGFVYGGPAWPARMQRAVDRAVPSEVPR
jgi:dihydroorotate dehydrogenase